MFRFDIGVPRGYSTACRLPASLIQSIVGHDWVTIPWHVIKDRLPTADTAFKSPSGDFLLVLDHGVLYAFIPERSLLGPEVAKFSLVGRPIVMR